MTLVNISDEYIVKEEKILKREPENNHRRFMNVTDINYSVFVYVTNKDHFEANTAVCYAEIDVLRVWIVQLENAISNI